MIKHKVIDSFGDINAIEWFEEDKGRFHKRINKDKIHNGSYPYAGKRLRSTGLLDENKSEIFEGDILGRYGYKYGSDEKIFTGTLIVQRCDKSAGFSLYSIGDNRVKMRNGMFPIDIDGLYIGGNINQST